MIRFFLSDTILPICLTLDSFIPILAVKSFTKKVDLSVHDQTHNRRKRLITSTLTGEST